MKEIKLIESEKPTNIKEIKKFADYIGAKLPEEYVCFLLKHNGGHPICDTFDFIESIDELDQTTDIAWFLALYDGYDENLQKDYETFKSRIPKDLLSIARDSGGNQICLCVSGKNYGKVYFWDHDWEADEGEEVTYYNVSLIANSFADFINSLYEFDFGEDKNDIWVYTHDKYSLPTSRYIRKHGKIITDFFDKAPKSVEEFIIKKFTANGDLLLSFKASGKEHFRRLNKDGKIIAGE